MTSLLQPPPAPYPTPLWSWPAFWRAFWKVPAIGAAGGFLVGLAASGTRHADGFPELPLLFSGLAALGGCLVGWPRGRRAAREGVVAGYTDAIRRDPAQPIHHFNRGQIYLWMFRDYRRAIADFDEAIRLAPDYPAAHLARVNACGALGRLKPVIAEYTEAIRRDPGSAIAYCCRATAYNSLGQTARSMPDAGEAIRLAPDLYLGYDARGYARLQRGRATGSRADLEQAVDDFTEALRLNAHAWDCYDGRAQAHRALGDTTSAARDEERARRREPEEHLRARSNADPTAPGPGGAEPPRCGEPRVHQEAEIHFLGEQDCPPGCREGPFKTAMCELFAGTPAVQRAYLARVKYTSREDSTVVLCIRAPEDSALVDRIADRFRQLFPAEAMSLEVMFVTADRERALQAVCRPFYVAAPRPGGLH